jgi:Protein of unknown function (DUF2786)
MTFADTRAVVSRVRKLKQLARSPNPHEAALAAAKAEELMDRHHLRLYWDLWEQAVRDLETFKVLAGWISRQQAARRKPREKARG